MILSNILSSATSLSPQGSVRLPEIAKTLAPVVRGAIGYFRHCDELLLMGSSFLVGAGVSLEVFELIHGFREKFGPFKLHRPEMPRWMFIAGFVGWFFIVGGVAGEFIFESAVGTRTEELESIGDALLGDAQLSAADAIKQAGDAASSAHNAAEDARSAFAKANAAGEAGSRAQESAKAADASAEGVRQLEAQLRTDLVESDLILAATESGHTFRPFLFRKLQSFAGKPNLTVEFPPDGGSATWMFAQKLNSALQGLGFKTSHLTRRYSGAPSTGIIVFNKWVSSDTKPFIEGHLEEIEVDPTYLVQYLQHAGVPDSDIGLLAHLSLALGAKLQKDPSLEDGTFRIAVGDPK
jgi:uncharacterized membrane protein